MGDYGGKRNSIHRLGAGASTIIVTAGAVPGKHKPVGYGGEFSLHRPPGFYLLPDAGIEYETV